MPKYFFNIHSAKDYYDEAGKDLPSIKEVRQEAVRFVEDMLVINDQKKLIGRKWELNVTDDTGTSVVRLMIQS